MITKWLKDRTPEEREMHLQMQIKFPLEQLRHNQNVVNASIKKAYELYTGDMRSKFACVRDGAGAKWDPVVENLRIMEQDLIEAVDRKCFAKHIGAMPCESEVR